MAFQTASSNQKNIPVLKLPRNRISSAALLKQAREVIIEHQDQEYHLRITSNGKLLLTK